MNSKFELMKKKIQSENFVTSSQSQASTKLLNVKPMHIQMRCNLQPEDLFHIIQRKMDFSGQKKLIYEKQKKKKTAAIKVLKCRIKIELSTGKQW